MPGSLTKTASAIRGDIDMGMFGKILVMFHTVLSLGMLTWAVGVYTQRINWNSPSKDAPGVFDRQKAKTEDLKDAMNRSYYRWTANYGNVLQFEVERFPRRVFYTSQMNLLQYGSTVKGGKSDEPAVPAVQELVLDPRTGFLDVTKVTGRKPIPAPNGGNVRSIVGYEAAMNQAYKDIAASQAKNTKLLADRDLVNNEITGVTKPMLVKGLRQQINEQKLIEDEAVSEVAYVKGFTTIREAEFGLLKKRRDALSNRENELKQINK
ncbi:hypothetical protein [Zavarzinella formosa]|uniref:hypothetical protein n=1 Tax=Zavarzinella formosa TaxID=360055 RepID=UPI0002D6D591|nr:hypothetical protein [Zavarzinella formosa]